MMAAVSGAVLLAATAPAAFEPERDFETTVRCFALFLKLADITAGQRADGTALFPSGRWTSTDSYRGHMRLQPFTRQAMVLRGERAFYRAATDYGLAAEASVAAVDGADRQERFDLLLEQARGCHSAMDDWGAPPFHGMPPELAGAE